MGNNSSYIPSTNNNDLLTPEAERFAQTRYPFPPFILRFPLANVKEQKVAEELCKYLNDNKKIHLELIGYRRSKLKCDLNESDQIYCCLLRTAFHSRFFTTTITGRLHFLDRLLHGHIQH